MDSKIHIEQFDFSHLDTLGGYIQINVHIGKMPPNKVKTYLDKYKNNASVCKLLKEMGIPFDIVPFREFESINIVTNKIRIEGE